MRWTGCPALRGIRGGGAWAFNCYRYWWDQDAHQNGNDRSPLIWIKVVEFVCLFIEGFAVDGHSAATFAFGAAVRGFGFDAAGLPCLAW